MHMQKAVIDRIVDDKQAVLLIGETEEECIVPIQCLPEEAVEGSILNIVFEENKIKRISLDRAATEEANQRINHKMALLRKKKGSQFKADA